MPHGATDSDSPPQSSFSSFATSSIFWISCPARKNLWQQQIKAQTPLPLPAPRTVRRQSRVTHSPASSCATSPSPSSTSLQYRSPSYPGTISSGSSGRHAPGMEFDLVLLFVQLGLNLREEQGTDLTDLRRLFKEIEGMTCKNVLAF